MEKQTRVRFLALLLLALLNSALAEDEPSYFVVGGNLVLRPLQATVDPRNIQWKHNGNLVAEFVLGDLTYYGSFIGRTTLNTTSGHLEIKSMTRADEGRYTVEINSVLQVQSIMAKAIQRVTKPVVWIQPLTCSALDRCKLTCNGNTAKAEPVSYSWKRDGEEWGETTKDVNFTKTDTAHVKMFSCRVKNPVSEEESDPIDNLFFQEEASSSGGLTAWGIFWVVFVVCGLAGLGFGFWKRDIIMDLCPILRGRSDAEAANGGKALEAQPLNSDPKPESDPKLESDPKPESDPKLESDPKPDPDPKTESDPKLESDPKTESDPKPESDPKTESDLKTESDPKPESDLKPDPDPKPDPDVAPGPDVAPDPDVAPGAPGS